MDRKEDKFHHQNKNSTEWISDFGVIVTFGEILPPVGALRTEVLVACVLPGCHVDVIDHVGLLFQAVGVLEF